jgi:hypothetical protein
MRGIYVMANDQAADNAIALLSSIRAYDPDVPVMLIPYDERHRTVAAILGKYFDVRPYEDRALIRRIDEAVRRCFGRGFFKKPQMFRKQACWFGPFDEFLYLDADIIVFERIAGILDYLAEFDFVCCDDQHRTGLKHVFSSRVLDERVLSSQEVLDVFNAGMFGAKKGLLTEVGLYAHFAECARHTGYFDFTTGCNDQPIFNYFVLKRIPRRINLFRTVAGTPRMWAGTPGFIVQGDTLVDPEVGAPLRFLHWAGLKTAPGQPYWETWRRFRFRHPGVPQRLLRDQPVALGRRVWWRVRDALGY